MGKKLSMRGRYHVAIGVADCASDDCTGGSTDGSTICMSNVRRRSTFRKPRRKRGNSRIRPQSMFNAFRTQLLASLSEDECNALKVFASPPCLCPFDNAAPVYVPCSGCSEPYTNPDSAIPEFSGDQISANCGDIYTFTEENQLTQEQCIFATESVQSTCVCEAPSAGVTSAPTSSSSVVSFVFGVAGVLFGTVIMMA